MNRKPLIFWETVYGLARVRGILTCSLVVARECFRNAITIGAVGTVCILIGQWMVSRIMWQQLVLLFALLFALAAVVTFLKRCFGHELCVIPHEKVLLTYLWRHEEFEVGEITSLRCITRGNGWVILEIAVGKGGATRQIEFVTHTGEVGCEALLDSLTAKGGGTRVRSE